MFGEGFFGGGPGFGGPGGPGFGGPGFGGPFGKHGRAGLKRAALGTAAMLLDGPADAAAVVQRVADKTDGAITPPQEITELAIGVLAGRGMVTVDDGGVATLTDVGKGLLAWRGVTTESAQAFLSRAAQFGDVFKIRRTLFEVAGLARTIAFSGTDEQKRQLAEARTKVLEALTDAKKALHRALADG